jgi:DNA-binding Xre family transcriptional regulator
MLTQRKKSEVLTNIIQSITEKDRLDMREKMFLAARIDDLRREKGLTLFDLAEKLNIDKEEMGEIIAGNKDLPMDLETLAQFLIDFNEN